ncbi:MAG TPA: hypothetical protein VGP72_10350 [Planctomycetota bacterium]|jgi:hypothetical protein
MGKKAKKAAGYTGDPKLANKSAKWSMEEKPGSIHFIDGDRPTESGLGFETETEFEAKVVVRTDPSGTPFCVAIHISDENWENREVDGQSVAKSMDEE